MMKRIGIIRHENYDPEKLEVIFKRLETASKVNQSHDYEMAIDQFSVIPRTSDLKRFDVFSEFVTANSECLVIYTYYGTSKQYDAYFFYFKSIPAYKVKNQTLGSVTNDEFEKEQKARILKEAYYEKLEIENQELKAKLEESEQKFKNEQEYWEEIKKGKVASFGEIGSAVLTSLLSNPNLQKMFPTLAMFGNPNQVVNSPLGNPPQQQEASFKRKGEKAESKNKEDQANASGNGLNEQEKNHLRFFRELSRRFDEQQLGILMNILKLLIPNPQALRSTQKHIQNFLNNKPKP